MKFIGRYKELNDLKQIINSDKKELVGIMGKRGVGKTTLINEFLYSIENNYQRNIEIIRLSGRNKQKMKNQIQNCTNVINDFFKQSKQFNDWFSFFNNLLFNLKDFSKNHSDKTIVFFIDEFPWLNTKGSDFVEEFGVFWNSLYGINNCKFILTGSAVSWMDKNIYQNKGGLYHKMTCKIHLNPFDLEETIEYLLSKNKTFNNSELLEYYLLTGGVVRYLEKIDFRRSVEENAIILFNTQEFDELFDSCFNSYKNKHKKVISLFEKKQYLTIKYIVDELNISETEAYRIIKDLKSSNFIAEIEKQINEGNNVKNINVYILTDLYCFYSLKISPHKNIYSLRDQKFSIFSGFAFEILAYNNIQIIKEEIKRAGFNTIVTKWQNKNAQIDLLLSYSDNLFSIIECKNYNKIYDFNLEDEYELLNKRNEFLQNQKPTIRKKAKIDFILFSMFGSKNNTLFPYFDISLNEIINRFKQKHIF